MICFNTPKEQIKKYREIIDVIEIYKKQRNHPLRKYYAKLKKFQLSTFKIFYCFTFIGELDINLMCQLNERSDKTNRFIKDLIDSHFDSNYVPYGFFLANVSSSQLINSIKEIIARIENEILLCYVLDVAQKKIIRIIHFRLKEREYLDAAYIDQPQFKLIDSISGYFFDNNCEFLATKSLR